MFSTARPPTGSSRRRASAARGRRVRWPPSTLGCRLKSSSLGLPISQVSRAAWRNCGPARSITSIYWRTRSNWGTLGFPGVGRARRSRTSSAAISRSSQSTGSATTASEVRRRAHDQLFTPSPWGTRPRPWAGTRPLAPGCGQACSNPTDTGSPPAFSPGTNAWGSSAAHPHGC
jgi:hypothetical protein